MSDTAPEFHFVPMEQVFVIARRTGAIPYDIPPGAELSHQSELCSFDAFLKRYQLTRQCFAATRRYRTWRRHFTPRFDATIGQLYAISLGLSCVFEKDHEMLQHDLVIY